MAVAVKKIGLVAWCYNCARDKKCGVAAPYSYKNMYRR